jgi:tRNA-Thr(GGU) m(6)t(6)A37 methyltransferase TsaA
MDQLLERITDWRPNSPFCLLTEVSMLIELRAIGFVRGGRKEPTDDDWDNVTASIELATDWLGAEALLGLDHYSHAEVIFHFHQCAADSIVTSARHPRGRKDWPLTGIFAQRSHARPNLLGITTCRILGISAARVLVQGLDAIDGTPVLDIKPYMKEFAPRGDVRQPVWSSELMREYWSRGG